MSRFVGEILKKLTEKGDIKEDEYELYYYAIECLFSLFAPLLFSIVIGLIIGKCVESILMIIPFACVRKFAGGYHSKNSKICLFLSIVIIAFFLSVGGLIECKMVIILGIISTFGLIIFSPIDSVNRRLDDDEKNICKKIVIIILLLAWFAIIFIQILGMKDYAKYMVLGILLSFALQMPVIIVKYYLKLSRIFKNE